MRQPLCLKTYTGVQKAFPIISARRVTERFIVDTDVCINFLKRFNEFLDNFKYYLEQRENLLNRI